MAKEINLPEFEKEMAKVKRLLEDLKKTQKIFNNSFTTMKPRERADVVKAVQHEQKVIQDFIYSTRKYDLRTPALKFAVENLKQSFQTTLTLWRKTEKLLENFTGSAKRSPQQASGFASPTDKAVQDYVGALKNLGHDASSEMVQEFRQRLQSAYNQAKTKMGGRDLDIHVVQVGGKIKVRMDPKD